MAENIEQERLYQRQVQQQAEDSSENSQSPPGHQLTASSSQQQDNFSLEFQSSSSQQRFQPHPPSLQAFQQEPQLFTERGFAQQTGYVSNIPQQTTYYGMQPQSYPGLGSWVSPAPLNYWQLVPTTAHPLLPQPSPYWPWGPPIPFQYLPFGPSPSQQFCTSRPDMTQNQAPALNQEPELSANNYIDESITYQEFESEATNVSSKHVSFNYNDETNLDLCASSSKGNENNNFNSNYENTNGSNSFSFNFPPENSEFQPNPDLETINESLSSNNEIQPPSINTLEEIDNFLSNGRQLKGRKEPLVENSNANISKHNNTLLKKNVQPEYDSQNLGAVKKFHVAPSVESSNISNGRQLKGRKEPLVENSNANISKHNNTLKKKNVQPEYDSQNLGAVKKCHVAPAVESSQEILSRGSKKNLASLSQAEIKSIWNFQIIKKPGPRAYHEFREKAECVSSSNTRVRTDISKATTHNEQKERAAKKFEQSSSPYIKCYYTLYSSMLPTIFYSYDGNKQLSYGIWNFYMIYILDEGQYVSNINVANEIQSFLEHFFRNFSSFLTGSILSGLAGKRSDINITISVPQVSDNDIKNTKMAFLKSVEAVLIKHGKASELQISGITDYKSTNTPHLDISRTSEKPKLQFLWWKKNPVKVMLTVNDSQSLTNTQLNSMYTCCDWRFQPLYCVIKRWFINRKFSGQENSLLSSYSISLIVIYFLQNACTPPVLPVIQEDNSVIFSTDYTKPIDIKKSSSYNWYSTNDMSLGELYVSFFKYYDSFDFKNFAVSIRTSDRVRNVSGSYICVEDPFTLINTVRYFNFQSDFIRLSRAIRVEKKKLDCNQSLDLAVTVNKIN